MRPGRAGLESCKLMQAALGRDYAIISPEEMKVFFAAVLYGVVLKSTPAKYQTSAIFTGTRRLDTGDHRVRMSHFGGRVPSAKKGHPVLSG